MRFKNSLATRDTDVRCIECGRGPKVVYASTKRGSKLRQYKAMCSYEICKTRLKKEAAFYYSKEEALSAWEKKQSEEKIQENS